MSRNDPRPRVVGSLYANTSEGFAKLLVEANQPDAEDYSLVTVVQLGDKIAAVYRRRERRDSSGAFFD